MVAPTTASPIRTTMPALASAVPLTVGVSSAVWIPSAGDVITGAAGATVSTFQVWLAGVASVLPARSVARTSKVCGPSASAPSVCGEVQAPQAPPSTRHSKVEPGSSLLNVKVGVVSSSSAGGALSIVVAGAVVSIVTSTWFDDAPLVAGGVGGGRREEVRTGGQRRCGSEAPVAGAVGGRRTEQGDVVVDADRAVGLGRAADGRRGVVGVRAVGRRGDHRSSRVGRVDRPAVRGRRRVDVADRIGGAHLEGVRAVGQADRPCGLVQAPQAPPSRLHSKLLPGSFELNSKLGLSTWLWAGGATSIVVSGAVVSIVQLWLCRRRVDVACLVDRAHLEGVRAVGERSGRVRRRADRPGAAVDAALEGRAGLVRTEA